MKQINDYSAGKTELDTRPGSLAAVMSGKGSNARIEENTRRLRRYEEQEGEEIRAKYRHPNLDLK